MTEPVTTYYSESKKAHVPIAGMSYPQTVNTIRSVEKKTAGGPSPLLDALRAHLASFPPQDATGAGQAAKPAAAAPPPVQDGPRLGGGLGGGLAAQEPRELKTLDRSDAPPPIGDNNPPADDVIAKLEEEYADLLTRLADHEIAAAGLPRQVDSDEDVEKITGWVVKARQLYKDAEAARVKAKDPHLTAGKKIDGFFGSIKEGLTDRAKTTEARTAPYLKAKRDREEAERQAAARAAEEARRKQEQEAAEARAREEAARKKAEEAAQAIKDAADAESRKAAELAAREASRQAQEAQRESEAADHDAGKAAKAHEKAERQAAGATSLEKTSGGGGSVKLKMVPKWKFVDEAGFKKSLGPIGPFLTQTAIEEALNRAMRDEDQPRIPGIYFYEEEEVQTVASRAKA